MIQFIDKRREDLNIFILEKHSFSAERVSEYVRESLEDLEIKPRIFEVSTNGKELLRSHTERGSHQLFFLEVSNQNQPEKIFYIARLIRIRDPYAIIVLLSKNKEIMPKLFTYHIAALDFIDLSLPESVQKERIAKAILHTKIQDFRCEEKDTFYYKNKATQIQIPISDIYFLETSQRSHHFILHTVKESVEFPGNLSDIQEMNPAFVRCHRSFLANPSTALKVCRKNRMIQYPKGLQCFIAKDKMAHVLSSLEL